MTDAQFPAGWYDDPMGRHEQRYYDGVNWTDRAAASGVEVHDPLENDPAPAASTTFEAHAADQTVVMSSGALAGDLVGGAQAATPAAAMGQPAAAAAPSGETKSMSGFLEALGDTARRREAPELPLALGGLGGALVGLGLLALIGQSGSRGAIIGASIVAIAIAFAAALKLLGDQPWLRTAATACCTVGLFGLAGGLVFGDGDLSSDDAGIFLLLTGVLHLICWIAPGFKGRPLMLGGGLVATSFGLALLVAGGGCGDDPFNFEQCNFAEEAAGQVGLSTGAGIVMLLIGAALLFAVRKLDEMDYRGTAETVAAAAIITLIFGAIALSVDLGSTGNSLVVIAVGLGLGIVGHLASRRALTWTGAALVAGGVIGLITNIVTTDDATVGSLVIIFIGAALIAVPRFIQLQAAQKAAAS